MRFLILVFGFVLISISVMGQSIEKKSISSKLLNQERTLWIYTPWQYEEYPEKHLEVIYVFDAQTREMFDAVHSTLQFIGGEEYAFIVVGVESPYIEAISQSRNSDFLPATENPKTLERYYGSVGKADEFMAFLDKELIPLIDSSYRTLPTTLAIGHSNGGTFVNYCMIREPGMFDGYITISPNFSYDENQMVNRYRALDPESLDNRKFLFISHSDEANKDGWMEALNEVLEILSDQKFETKIHLETEDFSATENHGTTYPIGIFYGLKAYIDYQFRTGENVIPYYEDLAEKKLISIDLEKANMYAYECFWNQKPKEALIIIKWAIDNFPDAHNLYDSQGEFYEVLGDLDRAAESFKMAIEKLEYSKNGMDQQTFEETREFYRGNYERIRGVR